MIEEAKAKRLEWYFTAPDCQEWRPLLDTAAPAVAYGAALMEGWIDGESAKWEQVGFFEGIDINQIPRGKYILSAGDTPALLQWLGFSRAGIWRAMGRGWYFWQYHRSDQQPTRRWVYQEERLMRDGLAEQGASRTQCIRAAKRGYLVEEEENNPPFTLGPKDQGHFGAMRDPYAFAHKMVSSQLRLWGLGEAFSEQIPDMVHEGLVRCWERRHHQNVTNPIAYCATIIRGKVRDYVRLKRHTQEIPSGNLQEVGDL